MEPSVKILYSESDHLNLQAGTVMSLGEANSFFEYRDVICEDEGVIENVVYEVSYLVNNETYTYCSSQNLGDGEGSVINHLRVNALDILKTLDAERPSERTGSPRNPFSILRNSCENMLNVVLPQLEAYCLAYKTVDVLESFSIKADDGVLQKNIPSIMKFIQDDPPAFVCALNGIISLYRDDISLVSAVETLVYKAERYMELMRYKEGKYKDLVGVLEKATQKAIVINETSILNQEPPPSKDELWSAPEYLG